MQFFWLFLDDSLHQHVNHHFSVIISISVTLCFVRQFIRFRLQIRIKDVDLDCKYKDIGSGSYCISLSS
ncbi:hypothetical protein Hdeb2414_s0012g00395891 [Helianthus debilis subsp. tardiflorus]